MPLHCCHRETLVKKIELATTPALTCTHVFSIIYLILIKYAVATFLTVFSSENFTNIAWDSAGVTTGPVTVPFVLSVGIGFSKAKNAEEGFGILTCASVAPIITVLFTDLLRRMIQSAVQAHNQRRLRRLVSTTSQTDSLEDLQLLLGPDSQARSERLRDKQECADAGTQCDLADIESSAAYELGGWIVMVGIWHALIPRWQDDWSKLLTRACPRKHTRQPLCPRNCNLRRAAILPPAPRIAPEVRLLARDQQVRECAAAHV